MRCSSVPASTSPRIGIVGRGAGPRTVAGCTLPVLISAPRGPAEAGIIRAMTSPRSVRVISSPRLTRANTFAVSWLSIRMDTSLTWWMYYKYVLHATDIPVAPEQMSSGTTSTARPSQLFRRGVYSGCGKNGLCLGDLRDQLAAVIGEVGLHDDGAAADVQRHAGCGHRPAAHRAEEVGLRLDRGGARTGRQVHRSAQCADRVGERHQRPAVHDSTGRAPLLGPGHHRAHAVRRDLVDGDPQCCGERHDRDKGRQVRGAHAVSLTHPGCPSPYRPRTRSRVVD